MSAHWKPLASLASAVAWAALAQPLVAQLLPIGGKTTTTKTTAAATVNGEPISMTELDAVVAQMGGGGPQALQIPEARRRDMRFHAIGMLIDEALFRQALLRQPPPKQTEVAKCLVDFEDGLKKANKNLDEFCKETGQSPAQVNARFVAMLQWRDFVNARVTDADLERYYTEFKPSFDEIEVRVSHIVLRVPPAATAAERQAAQAKLVAIREQLVTGKIDFAAAAKAYSQCPSAKDGGEMGFIKRKWGMVEESFARAAFDPRLKPGDVSDVVTTEYGVHLIRLLERTPGKPSTFAEKKALVREYYIEDLRQEVIASQRKASKVEITLP